MDDIKAGKLVYEPAEDWYGMDSSMKFLARDKKGNRNGDITKATTAMIKVVHVNNTPVIVYQDGDEEVKIREDKTLPEITTDDNKKYTFTFKVEDPDSEPADIKVKVDSDGDASCKVIKNPDGTYTVEVTPKINEPEHDEEITITVSDGESERKITIPVTVKYVEKIVKAVPDGAKTGESGSIVIDVLKNDELPDPAKRQITGIKITMKPAGGKAEVIQSGSSWKVRYTADSGKAEADKFSYTIVLTGGSMTGDKLTADVFMNQEGKAVITVGPQDEDSGAEWKKETDDDGNEVWKRTDDNFGKDDKIKIEAQPAPGSEAPVAEVTVLDEKGNVVEKWSLKDGDTPDEDGKVTIEPTLPEKGEYTVIVKDVCGNETIQKIVEDKIDNTPPRVDLGGAKPEKKDDGTTVITGVQITDDDDDEDGPGGSGGGEGGGPGSGDKPGGGSGVDPDNVTITPSGAQIKKEDDGSYTIILPPGTNPEDSEITIKDNAGNEITLVVDLVKPLLERVEEEKADTLSDEEEKPNYLPVVVKFEDYTDEELTKHGTVVSIYVAEGEDKNGVQMKNVTPRLPRFEGTAVLSPAVKPYVSGGENVTVYRMIAKDAAGNRTEYKVVIGNIPSPGSITKDNLGEVEDILDEIERQIGEVRPGIDAPEEECDRIKDALEDARKKIKDLRKPQGGGDNPGGGDDSGDDGHHHGGNDGDGGSGGNGGNGSGGTGTGTDGTGGDGTGTGIGGDGTGSGTGSGTGNDGDGTGTGNGSGGNSGNGSGGGTGSGNGDGDNGGSDGTGDGTGIGNGDGAESGNGGSGAGTDGGGNGGKDKAGNKPFILLSALLALAAAALAVLTFIRKKYDGKWKTVTLASALISVLLFFMTTGWHGMKFANAGTIPVAVFALAAAAAAYMASRKNEEEEKEEI